MAGHFALMQLGGKNGFFHLHPHPELKELYIFSLLYSFAYALIVIFEPIFLYQQGFSLSFIALYYGLHYTLYTLLLPLGGKFAARFGLERSLSASLPIMVVYFLVLASIPSAPSLIWTAIVLLTVYKIFYWPSFNALFSKFGDSHNRGTELSWMRVLQQGVGVIGPLIGGIVATVYGFPTLFVLTALLVLLSALPLLRTKESYHAVTFLYRDPWRIIGSRQHRNVTMTMMGMGENLIDMVFWPIFLLIVLGSAEKVGVVSSVNLGIMTLFGFLIGEMSDRFPRRYVLRFSLPFLVLSYLFRPLSGTALRVFLTDGLARLAFAGVNIPMTHKLYTQAQTTSIIRFTTAYEMALAIAKAGTAFVLAVVFALALPYTGFAITFVLAAFLVLMYLFL